MERVLASKEIVPMILLLTGTIEKIKSQVLYIYIVPMILLLTGTIEKIKSQVLYIYIHILAHDSFVNRHDKKDQEPGTV